MEAITRNTILLIGLVILDQILKAIVESIKPMIDFGIFSIHYVVNTGASFGILQGNNSLLIFVSLIVLGIIMMNVKQIKGNHELPAIFIVSGLLGNLIDRLFRGFVVDFFDLKFWPVFNLADSVIVVGVIWLSIAILIDSKEEQQKPKPRRKK